MRKLWFSIICALVATGCDDDGFTTEKLDNFRDPRANYELQSVEFLTASITDAISLDVRGWEVENLSRKVTFKAGQYFESLSTFLLYNMKWFSIGLVTLVVGFLLYLMAPAWTNRFPTT